MYKGGISVGDVRKVHLKKLKARRAWGGKRRGK